MTYFDHMNVSGGGNGVTSGGRDEQQQLSRSYDQRLLALGLQAHKIQGTCEYGMGAMHAGIFYNKCKCHINLKKDLFL